MGCGIAGTIFHSKITMNLKTKYGTQYLLRKIFHLQSREFLQQNTTVIRSRQLKKFFFKNEFGHKKTNLLFFKAEKIAALSKKIRVSVVVKF
jgi:hypothetical protein